MANELWALATPGLGTLAAELRPVDKSQAWNGSAFAPIASLTDVQWAAGLIRLTETKTAEGTSTRVYVGSMPAGLPAAEYVLRVFEVPNPTPERLPIAEQVIAWTGVAEVSLDRLAKPGDAMTSTPEDRAAIADAWLDRVDGIETGVTPRQAIQRIGAVVAGKVSGAGLGIEVFVGLDGITPRVTVTVDDAGNRTGVEYA